jgi:hypothetical protein
MKNELVSWLHNLKQKSKILLIIGNKGISNSCNDAVHSEFQYADLCVG